MSYVDQLGKFEGNEYTTFGTALHEACERKMLDNNHDEVKAFSEAFERELLTIPSTTIRDFKLTEEMREQGKMLAPMALPALKNVFGNFTLLAVEEDIYEKIKAVQDWDFKGFIDLVIKDEAGIIHIIDWKSCAWGWDAKKKTDPMLTYQLTLYKFFYAQKHGIDPDTIETHFALLKRTAKKDNVEVFRVTSGDKKTQNALNLMTKALYSIDKGFFPKNRLSCKYCVFYKTKDCP